MYDYTFRPVRRSATGVLAALFLTLAAVLAGGQTAPELPHPPASACAGTGLPVAGFDPATGTVLCQGGE